MTLLRYFVDKPKSSHARVRAFRRTKEVEKFQQSIYVKNELEELVYRLYLMSSVKKLSPNIQLIESPKNNAPIFLTIFLSLEVRVNWNIGDSGNLFVKLNSKWELYNVVLTTPKISRKRTCKHCIWIETNNKHCKCWSQRFIFCLKWT